MHALVQSIEVFVVVLAAAAFAHFGVTLKDAPPPKATPAVQRVPASTAPVASLGRRAHPCPLAGGVRRA